MRKFITLTAASIIIISCGDKSATTTTKQEVGINTNKVEYAYTIEHPDQWESGSHSNTQMVLKSLKAYEEGNIEESLKAFADTVMMQFDGFEAKMGKDSLLTFLKRGRSDYKSMKIIMDDFESVKSKDGKNEFVSLWYKQIWEDQKGKTDSLECMDDAKISGGKIVYLNGKIRHYPAKKM